MKKQTQTNEDQLYIISLILLIAAAPLFKLFTILREHCILLRLPCVLRTLTGYICPGCGGTRAVVALMHGHVWISLLYHPIVLYATLILLWFIISQSIERFSHHRLRIGLHYHSSIIVTGLIIFAVNYVIKLGAQLICHTDLLELLDTISIRFQAR